MGGTEKNCVLSFAPAVRNQAKMKRTRQKIGKKIKNTQTRTRSEY